MTIGDLRRLCRYIEHDDNGCWIWTGSKTKGYGTTSLGRGNRQYVHRALYAALAGPIPPGFQIDHLCRVPCCVNPRHLEPVTPRVNNRRGLKGALKQACANGHPWTSEHIGRRKNGRRFCLVCKREQQRIKNLETRRSSPYPYVHWSRSSWRGIYYRNGEQIYVGRFPTPEEARDAVARHREFANA